MNSVPDWTATSEHQSTQETIGKFELSVAPAKRRWQAIIKTWPQVIEEEAMLPWASSLTFLGNCWDMELKRCVGKC